MIKTYAERSGLMWDACCLVNLAASGRAEEILSSLGCPSFVVNKVYEQEVIYLRPMAEDKSDNLEKIDLTPLMQQGLLQETILDQREQDMFVDLARELDDGEAMTLAAAIHRGFSLVSDDRVAWRLAREQNVPILTTPGWLKYWANISSISSEEIKNVIKYISIRARFLPPRRDPDYQWWLLHA